MNILDPEVDLKPLSSDMLDVFPTWLSVLGLKPPASYFDAWLKKHDFEEQVWDFECVAIVNGWAREIVESYRRQPTRLYFVRENRRTWVVRMNVCGKDFQKHKRGVHYTLLWRLERLQPLLTLLEFDVFPHQSQMTAVQIFYIFVDDGLDAGCIPPGTTLRKQLSDHRPITQEPSALCE